MSVKKKKLILLDTRSWILRRNKRTVNNTLVQELTFENGVKYRGMFRIDECDFKTKYETTNKLELLGLLLLQGRQSSAV